MLIWDRSVAGGWVSKCRCFSVHTDGEGWTLSILTASLTTSSFHRSREAAMGAAELFVDAAPGTWRRVFQQVVEVLDTITPVAVLAINDRHLRATGHIGASEIRVEEADHDVFAFTEKPGGKAMASFTATGHEIMANMIRRWAEQPRSGGG